VIVARSEPELLELLSAARPDGFVPTLGALHGGHRALLRAARTSGGVVVGSIFVNPLQFGPGEDFAAYPRSESADLRMFEAEGVDIAFVPPVEEMYPRGSSTTVTVGPLSRILEGAHRPGHFDGVATVCAKLFNLVHPRRAFFGQKDAQQVAVIRKMVTDLDFDIEIVVCSTVREDDGLAISSRNSYLSPEQRRQAVALYRSLAAGRSVLDGGGDPPEAEGAMYSLLEAAPGVDADYAVVCDPDTFEPPHTGRPALLAVAARVGRTRLIDNLLWAGPSKEVPGAAGR
jgi:pantoate--beta-alanine ligase